MFIPLHIAPGCFQSPVAELSSFKRGSMAHRVKRFTIWPFTDKVCQSLIETKDENIQVFLTSLQ